MSTQETIYEESKVKTEKILESKSQNEEEICGQINGKENPVEQHKLSLMRISVEQRDPSAKVLSFYPYFVCYSKYATKFRIFTSNFDLKFCLSPFLSFIKDVLT